MSEDDYERETEEMEYEEAQFERHQAYLEDMEDRIEVYGEFVEEHNIPRSIWVEDDL